MWTSLGSIVLLGAALAAVIAWLTSRPQRGLRIAGLALATLAAAYCGFIVFALLDGGRMVVEGGPWRLPGALATLAFAIAGMLVSLGARFGRRWHPRT